MKRKIKHCNFHFVHRPSIEMIWGHIWGHFVVIVLNLHSILSLLPGSFGVQPAKKQRETTVVETTLLELKWGSAKPHSDLREIHKSTVTKDVQTVFWLLWVIIYIWFLSLVFWYYIKIRTVHMSMWQCLKVYGNIKN